MISQLFRNIFDKTLHPVNSRGVVLIKGVSNFVLCLFLFNVWRSVYA